MRVLVFAVLLPFAALSIDTAWGEAPVRLVLKDHKLTPAQVSAPAGQRFKIEVVNQDDTSAEFESYDLKVEKIIVAGGVVTVSAGPLHPGTYKLFDDYHPDTAHGLLTVSPGNAASGE